MCIIGAKSIAGLGGHHSLYTNLKSRIGRQASSWLQLKVDYVRCLYVSSSMDYDWVNIYTLPQISLVTHNSPSHTHTHTHTHTHLLSHVMMMSLTPSPVKSATTGCCTGWQGIPNSDVVPPSSDCNMVAISQPTTRTCVCMAGGTKGRKREI